MPSIKFTKEGRYVVAKKTDDAPSDRRLIRRVDMAHIAGVTEATLNRWYADRANNGHPEPVGRSGRALLFDEQEWRNWHQGFLAAKKETLTTVDRSGDPDELIGIREFARVLGYTGVNPAATIRGYLRQNPGYLPEPEPGHEDPPEWTRRTAWEYADSRDKRGGARPTSANLPPRYANHPLLNRVRAALAEPNPPTVAELARRLRIGKWTARRLVKAAREHGKPTTT